MYSIKRVLQLFSRKKKTQKMFYFTVVELRPNWKIFIKPTK